MIAATTSIQTRTMPTPQIAGVTMWFMKLVTASPFL